MLLMMAVWDQQLYPVKSKVSVSCAAQESSSQVHNVMHCECLLLSGSIPIRLSTVARCSVPVADVL